jgi:hypothetical protein
MDNKDIRKEGRAPGASPVVDPGSGERGGARRALHIQLSVNFKDLLLYIALIRSEDF